MKRKTSQKTRLSCQTDLVVRSSRQGETIFRSFRASSYLVKFLGTLTRVVRLATRPWDCHNYNYPLPRSPTKLLIERPERQTF